MAENYSLHMPARKAAAAAARWGLVLCEEDRQRNWEDVLVYNVCVEATGGVCACLCVSSFTCVHV